MLDDRVLPLGLTLVEASSAWCLESDQSTERENAWHGLPVEVTSYEPCCNRPIPVLSDPRSRRARPATCGEGRT